MISHSLKSSSLQQMILLNLGFTPSLGLVCTLTPSQIWQPDKELMPIQQQLLPSFLQCAGAHHSNRLSACQSSQSNLYSETEDGFARHEPAQSGPSALCSRLPQADCEDSDLAVTSIHISHLSWKHQAYIPGSMPQHGTSISDLHLPAAGQCRSLEGHNFNQVLLSGADFHLF